jgi:predicted secreted Zn-dependent protease
VWHCLNIRQLVPGWLLLAGACNPPPIVVPAPPPPVPALASAPAGRAVLALAASAPTLPADVLVKDDTTYYAITGATVGEIGRQLGIGHGDSGSDFVGATVAQVEWQFAQRRRDDTCAITEVRVILHVQTHLPQWMRPARVSPTLDRQWSMFLEANTRHENGHRNIALHTAVAIARSLADEHGLPCPELDQLANASAHAQWELGHLHQLTYDAVTLHGETQGSRWPPFIGSPP